MIANSWASHVNGPAYNLACVVDRHNRNHAVAAVYFGHSLSRSAALSIRSTPQRRSQFFLAKLIRSVIKDSAPKRQKSIDVRR